MRRNLKMGLILGIALFMLLPVYARAHMDLSLQPGSSTTVTTGGSLSVASVIANLGDKIIFQVTSPLSGTITFSMIMNPDPRQAPTATFTPANAIFTWDTSSNAPPVGTYTGVFYADNGIDEEQLTAVITINPSSGGSGGSSPSPPSPPVLSSPSNGATSVSINPTLSWNASSGATSYGIQVATDSGFASKVVDQTGIIATSYGVTTNLSNNTLYYWRVNATNANGTSSWSTPWSFTTQAASGGGTGTYSQQVATAVKLNQPLSVGVQAYGYYQPNTYTIPKGATVYFLADPTGFGVQVNSKVISLNVLDAAQGANGIINMMTVIILDSSNNLWPTPKNPINVSGPSQNFGWRDYSYVAGKKYLIVVTEQGVKDTPLTVYWAVN